MQTIIVILIVAAAAFFTGRRLYRGFRGKEGCGCGCEGSCENTRSCHSGHPMFVDAPEHGGPHSTPNGKPECR